MSCVTFLAPDQRAALIAGSPQRPIDEVLAEHPVPPVTAGKIHRLRILAGDPNPKIRQSAASSRHAPPDLLAGLAADEEVGVRCCVARNEQAAEPTLRDLAHDPAAVVRGWVAANSSTPAGLLDLLATDDDESVRAVVAWSRNW